MKLIYSSLRNNSENYKARKMTDEEKATLKKKLYGLRYRNTVIVNGKAKIIKGYALSIVGHVDLLRLGKDRYSVAKKK